MSRADLKASLLRYQFHPGVLCGTPTIRLALPSRVDRLFEDFPKHSLCAVCDELHQTPALTDYRYFEALRLRNLSGIGLEALKGLSLAFFWELCCVGFGYRAGHLT